MTGGFSLCLGGVVGYHAILHTRGFHLIWVVLVSHTRGPQFEPGLRHFVTMNADWSSKR